MPHQPFKQSDNVSDFLTSHKKLAVFIGVFVTCLLCGLIIILFVPEKRQLILSNPNDENKTQIDLTKNYQQELNNILKNYWAARQASEESVLTSTCQTDLNAVIEKVLNLTVPQQHKDLHLNLVILLDTQEQACQAEDLKTHQELTAAWQDFFSNYSWLQVN